MLFRAILWPGGSSDCGHKSHMSSVRPYRGCFSSCRHRSVSFEVPNVVTFSKSAFNCVQQVWSQNVIRHRPQFVNSKNLSGNSKIAGRLQTLVAQYGSVMLEDWLRFMLEVCESDVGRQP